MPQPPLRPWLLPAILSCALLAGCKGPEAEPVDTPRPTVPAGALLATPTTLPTPAGLDLPEGRSRVVIWLAWSPAEIESLLRIVHRFRQDHPEVLFEVSYFPQADLAQSFVSANRAGTGPTVVIGPDTWGPELWQQSAIQDLTGLMAAGLRESVYPAALAQAEYGGSVLGLPLEIYGTVLYANARLAPAPIDSVETLPEADGGVRGAFDLGVDNSGPFLAACGGEWMDEAGQPAFSAAGVCWLELIRNLYRSGTVAAGSGDDLARFESGNAGWIFGSTRDLERLRSSIGEADLQIAPWPAVELGGRRLSGYVRTVNAYLAAGIQQDDLEASWAFMASLLSPEAQQEFTDPGGANHLPTLRSTILEDPLRAAALARLADGTPYPLQPAFALYRVPLERAIDAATRQAGNLQLIVERAAREVQQALAPTPVP